MSSAPPRPSRILAELFADCEGFAEFRAIPSKDRTFVPVDHIAAAAPFVSEHRPTDNLYFGVATRRDDSSGTAANCKHLPALFVDIDAKNGNDPHVALADFALKPTLTVRSGSGANVHVYWKLREPLDVDDDDPTPLLRRLAFRLGGDIASAEVARVLRIPGTLNHKNRPARDVTVETFDPELTYNPSDFDEVLPPEPKPAGATRPRPDIDTTFTAGERNAALFQEARRLKRAGHAVEEALALLLVFNRRRCLPPHTDREVNRACRSAFDQPDRPGFEPRPIQVDPKVDVTTYSMTDSGNAEALAASYGHCFRFDHRRRLWLEWNAPVWTLDADREISRQAHALIRRRLAAAADIADSKVSQAHAKWAMACERRERRAALITLAQDEQVFALAGDEFDQHPMLLACSNGVIDLETGDLRPGAREDYLTRSTSVAYDPDAEAPRFLQFLEEIFCGDEALINFIWRAVGYSLTGLTREEVVFFLFGGGSNGKTVFQNAIKSVVGDYAWTTPFSTFELNQRQSIPNDIAALVGRRLVIASETSSGTRLNEALLKKLTGGDTVTARFLHGEFFEFKPILKLWLAANHKPEVRDDSVGFWRRVRLVPFRAAFTDTPDEAHGELPIDPTLATQLAAERPGILAWAVNGCREWHRHGLAAPASVTEATAEVPARKRPVHRIRRRTPGARRAADGHRAGERDVQRLQGLDVQARLPSRRPEGHDHDGIWPAAGVAPQGQGRRLRRLSKRSAATY